MFNLLDHTQIKTLLALVALVSTMTTFGINYASLKWKIEVAQDKISANSNNIEANAIALSTLRSLTRAQEQIDKNQNEKILELKKTIIGAERVSF